VAVIAWTSSRAMRTWSAWDCRAASQVSMVLLIWAATCASASPRSRTILRKRKQVQRLDRGRALVKRVDLRVADVLLDRVILQEARTAEGLQ